MLKEEVEAVREAKAVGGTAAEQEAAESILRMSSRRAGEGSHSDPTQIPLRSHLCMPPRHYLPNFSTQIPPT